jgi:hypothetical protein
MPYYIIASKKCPASRPWGLFSRASGDLKGCHATKASARQQQKLLYAREGGYPPKK